MTREESFRNAIKIINEVNKQDDEFYKFTVDKINLRIIFDTVVLEEEMKQMEFLHIKIYNGKICIQF